MRTVPFAISSIRAKDLKGEITSYKFTLIISVLPVLCKSPPFFTEKAINIKIVDALRRAPYYCNILPLYFTVTFVFDYWTIYTER